MITKAPYIRRDKSEYLLEVVTTPSTKSVSKSQIKGGFSYAKKLLVTLLIVVLGVFGTGTAALAATSNAKTANAIEIDLFKGMCTTLDSPGAYLGGTSPAISNGWNGSVGDSPVGNGLNITIPSEKKVNPYVTGTGEPKSGQKWTALEQYGYYSPSFETYKGTLYEDKYSGSKIWPFVGTGGDAQYGDIVAITDADRSMIMFPSSFDCLTNNVNVNVGIGNFFFFITKFSVALASEAYGLAANTDLTSETSPLSGLATGVSDMITGGDNPEGGLRQILFLDWLVVIIIIGTFGLIWTGLIKRRGMVAGQSALWMIGASVMGAIFLFNPLLVPTIVDDVVGEVSSSITTAIIPAENSNTNLCEVSGTGADASIRQVKCSIWYATIYTPWVKGQFGVDEYDVARYANPDKSSLKGDSLESVNAVSWMYSDAYKSPKAGSTTNVANWEAGKNPEGNGFPEISELSVADVSGSRGILDNANIKFGDAAYKGDVNWAIYMLDRQNNWSKASTGLDYSEVAFNQLVINKNENWKSASEAISSSLLSVISAGGPILVLSVTSFTLIGYQLSMLLLMALSPFLLLLGVAPGWGRRLSMRWLELLVGLLFKRIILILFLALFIKLYMIVLHSEIDWWVQGIIVAVLSFVVLNQRAKIVGIFNNVINFGGDKSMDGGESMAGSAKQQASQAAHSARRTAVGLVSRGVANKKAAQRHSQLTAAVAAGRKPAVDSTSKNTPTGGGKGPDGTPPTGGGKGTPGGSSNIPPTGGGTGPTGGGKGPGGIPPKPENPNAGGTLPDGRPIPPKPPLPKPKERLGAHAQTTTAAEEAKKAKMKAIEETSTKSQKEQVEARRKANVERKKALQEANGNRPAKPGDSNSGQASPRRSATPAATPLTGGATESAQSTPRPIAPNKSSTGTPSAARQRATPTPTSTNNGTSNATPPITRPPAAPRPNTPPSGSSLPPRKPRP